ncbi:PREDICTED: mitochondrial antiviral-signaling protein [Mesitornis unicolor]|uniref:mitochondrial antiviral-signaling protein n=1 Tax=Mesitornis unicolor TaxID=54374 RepID=UPI000528BB0E|nr:PREDICTED: mitochondrial antiviral-signaling protein [Mesitornis unicolor]
MGFAEDKVYDYILKNLRNFKNIRVASLADSLSCLTDADRDELHSREEMRGSQATVYRFYQHLKCRQGWVPDLIDALRHNNAGHLADELQRVYDSWQARPPASSAASSPPATSNAHPSVSSVSAQMLSPGPNPAPGAPLAEEPCQDLPTAGCSPVPLAAATTTSTDLDARAPVQESLPKNLQQDSPRPPLHGNVVAMGTPGPRDVPPERGQDWLSRQQHPVCVDNRCFGNANHLHRGAPGLGLGRSLPPRDVGAAHSPEQPRNEPEEDVYISTESSSRVEGSRGPQPPDSLPKNQAVPDSEPPGSFVDVRSPLLIQQQFDAEQKRVGMLQEHRRDGDTRMETTTPVATPVPRDASPSCDISLKPPVQERKLPAGDTASSTHSMQTEEKVLPASSDALLAAERTASQVSSATSIWESSSNVEGNVELSKPGVLLSVIGESPGVGGRCLTPQGPSSPYSSLTLRSDPLLVSSDSSSSGEASSTTGCWAPATHEDPEGEKEAAGASRDSRLPPSWDNASLSTHEVHVDHYPSTQLRAGSDLRYGAGPCGNTPVFDSSSGTTSSSSQAKTPSGDSERPSLPYIVPAVGIAVISALAFLVYARLQK